MLTGGLASGSLSGLTQHNTCASKSSAHING
jgi:hypothetical protein